jgi:nucleoside-diphosphate-sugar epimerase
MKKAAIVGGAGFIGSHVVEQLVNLDIETVVIDDLSTGFKTNIHKDATFYNLNIFKAKQEDLTKVLEGVDVVFHLAALARVQPSIIDPVYFDKVNTNGTVNLLKACVEAKVKRVVYSASSSCYGNATSFPTSESHPINPLSPYGLQKYIGEIYCKMFSEVYGLDTVSLRYFNVYGERMSFEGAYKLVLAVFMQQYADKIPLTITNDGEQRRDFTYVGDVANANILAAKHPAKLNGQSFNIGNGKNYSVNEIASMFGGERNYFKKVLEPFETLADNENAKKILGWVPKGNLEKWIQKFKTQSDTGSY